MPVASCPLCSKFEGDTRHRFEARPDHNKHLTYISCARCGEFSVHTDLLNDDDGMRTATEAKLVYLSGLARKLTAQKPRLQLTWDNWADFDFTSKAPSNPSSYYERVLLELASHAKYPGTSSFLHLGEASARIGLPTTIMAGIVAQLGQAKLLDGQRTDIEDFSVRLTIEGWQRVDTLTTRRDPSRRAFVAMWFDPGMSPAYGAIAAMLQSEGYRPPFRVDDAAHDELPEGERHTKIDDRILAEIRGSRFIIADFTGNRQAVYYEAGFADGLGIPVLWCCKDGPDFKALNFDTRQREHIKWSDEADLARQLQAKIRRHGWSWIQ
jgi:hypothetical protein